jgi:hypothetical protein
MGILNICLIFIYRLKLKVKMLKMALTLDERVEIVLLSGRQGWCMPGLSNAAPAGAMVPATYFPGARDILSWHPILLCQL